MKNDGGLGPKVLVSNVLHSNGSGAISMLAGKAGVANTIVIDAFGELEELLFSWARQLDLTLKRQGEQHGKLQIR